jgi:polar amino acid transport system substrate-binding protein
VNLRNWKSLLLLIAFKNSSTLAQPSTLIVGADDWCPFTCDNQEKPGIIVEIGKKILKEKGISIDYKILPWPKAVRESAQGTIHALAGASRPDGVHLVFPLEEQGLQKSCVYFPKKSKKLKSYSNLTELRGLKIGITSGYSYGEPLDSVLGSKSKKKESGIEFIETSNATPTEELMKWSTEGKIEAFVESDSVLNFNAQRNQWKELPTSAFCFQPIHVYFSFSDKHPNAKQLAIWLTEGTQNLRKSGELKKILYNYGLVDWK